MKLTLTSTGFDVGYADRGSWHLMPIPRDVLGSTGKILEELLEYEDACAQNLFLLRAFELADMIGALAAYLWTRQVPFDLAQPSEQASQRVRLLTGLGFSRSVRQLFPSLEVCQDVEHIQILAETLLILIFKEGESIGLRISDLLAQAQLRAAIAQNQLP